jgi:hypothetical protein
MVWSWFNLRPAESLRAGINSVAHALAIISLLDDLRALRVLFVQVCDGVLDCLNLAGAVAAILVCLRVDPFDEVNLVIADKHVMWKRASVFCLADNYAHDLFLSMADSANMRLQITRLRHIS